VRRGRGESFGTRQSHRTDPGRLLREAIGRIGSAAAFGLPANEPADDRPSGRSQHRPARSQTKPRLCLPHPSREMRDPWPELEPQGKGRSFSVQRFTRGRHRNVFDPKAHGSIERSRSGNASRTQRTLRWNKALRSGCRWIRGDTEPTAPNGERERHSVNAPESARRRGGDELVRLPEREKLRRVFAAGKSSKRPSGRDHREVERSWKQGEPQGRLRGATNPHAVEGPTFGSGLCGGNRWSREERQERNESGTWQSRAEVWATVQTGVDAETVMSAKGPG